jgi:putative ABC transport system permease protein
VVSLDLQRTMTPADRRPHVFEQILESVRAAPGVDTAAATLFAPISGAWSEGRVEVPGFETVPQRERQVYFNTISEDYFRTLGVPFFSGRDFGRRDSIDSSRVAIVNEAFARRFFGRTNPVGKRFAREGLGTTEIVGFVGDAKYRNLREPAPPTVFLPVGQRTEPEPWLHLVVRSRANVASLTSSVGSAITAVDERIVFEPRTLERDVDDSLIQERLLARLSGFFGVLAVLVASIGLYGVMSLSVVRRQREIGVRLALGALPWSVFWMMLREVAIVTTVGLLTGSVTALISARFLAALLFGLEPTDVMTLATAVAVLGATATLAGYLPARRAARVNPAAVLHQD